MNYTFETGYNFFEKRMNVLFHSISHPLRLGIACSGGPDSILLFYYIFKYKEKHRDKIDFLLLIHIIDGHQLVEDSLNLTMQQARDLVVLLADSFFVKYIIYNNENREKFLQKISIEQLCHKIRKEFFEKAKIDFKLDRILTGHTLNDQLEHFFIGIIRRSSLRRISGMKEDSLFYFRPLLFMHKSNVQVILNDNNKKYVLDPCNYNKQYLRNKLRNDLMPLLNIIDNRFEDSLFNFMDQLINIENFLDKLVDIEFLKNNIFNIKYFLSLNNVICCKIIEKVLYKINYKKIVSIAICKEIIRFLATDHGGEHFIDIIVIIKKNGSWLIQLKS